MTNLRNCLLKTPRLQQQHYPNLDQLFVSRICFCAKKTNHKFTKRKKGLVCWIPEVNKIIIYSYEIVCFGRRILGISAIWYKSVYYQIWIFGPACAALPATDWSFRFSIQENRKLRYEDSNAMQKFQQCRKVKKFVQRSTLFFIVSC